MENTSSMTIPSSSVNANEIPPEKISPKGYLPFVEARAFAASLGLKTRKEWRLWVKEGAENKQSRPANIPAHPDGIYKVRGWQGWKHWLGTTEGLRSEDLN